MNEDSPDHINSIGIDIGTTTTQVVVSELTLSTPTYDGAAKVEILDREVRYRSDIHETPYTRGECIHTAEVLALIDEEIRASGLSPEAIETGAVIATGEAARTENAARLLDELAEHAGEFVIATAGAAHEAILAGYGSGAGARSEREHSTVMTVDIGGGTTNIALFVDGTVEGTRCIDIGGRDIRFDSARRVAAIAPSLQPYLDMADTPVRVGATLETDAAREAARWMADRIFDTIEGPPFEEATTEVAILDLPDVAPELDEVVFTGGVGRLVAEGSPDDPLAFDDFGPSLADAIRRHDRFESLPVRLGETAIRATVVGVGTQTTSFTGRTIAPNPELLPARNLPIVPVERFDGSESLATLTRRIERSMETARDRRGSLEAFALYLPALGGLNYDRIGLVAEAIAGAYESQFGGSTPAIVLTGENCAKVLAQRLAPLAGSRPTMVLDEVELGDERYVDFGQPLSSGGGVPVTLKTLVFDE